MARVREGCDCGCNEPVARTPEKMLRFLANRFETGGVSESVADIYAHDIRLILKEYYDPKPCPVCGEDGGTSCGSENCGYGK